MNMEKVWKALSDKNRRRILDILRESEMTTGGICSHFKKITRYGVMKHLGILEKAGLIIVKREGKHRWNYINPVPIREIYERWVRKYEENWSSYLIQLKNIAESDKKEFKDDSKKHNHK
jgi:DNA-binding transcriptional ArsR family regulator